MLLHLCLGGALEKVAWQLQESYLRLGRLKFVSSSRQKTRTCVEQVSEFVDLFDQKAVWPRDRIPERPCGPIIYPSVVVEREENYGAPEAWLKF